MAEKTLAMRILEGRDVDYETLFYDASIKDASQVASALGLAEDEVFKTLVVIRTGRKPILAMIPAGIRLDLKKLAKATGDKKVKMASQATAEKLTDLQVGGISALALLNRGFDMWLNRSVLGHQHICVSAGKRGIQLRLLPQQLIDITGARLAAIARVDSQFI